jgi:hypothetical protein
VATLISYFLPKNKNSSFSLNIFGNYEVILKVIIMEFDAYQ